VSPCCIFINSSPLGNQTQMGHDKTNETMEVPCFEGFFALKTNLWPVIWKASQIQLRERKKEPCFLKE
jgi:hypothetical protein